jgi:hypothetical protein
MCIVPTMDFFCTLISCFPCTSSIVWMILRWFQLSFLLIGITFAFTLYTHCMCVVISYIDLANILDRISVSSNRITRHFSAVGYWANGFAGILSHGLWCTSSHVSTSASYPQGKLLKEHTVRITYWWGSFLINNLANQISRFVQSKAFAKGENSSNMHFLVNRLKYTIS